MDAEVLQGLVPAGIHVLEMSPAAVFGVSSDVGEEVGQGYGVVEEGLEIGHVESGHARVSLCGDLEVHLDGVTSNQTLPRFVAE